MLEKHKKFITAAAAIAVVAAIGITLAFMFKKAKTANTFTKAVVSCSVHEKLDGKEVSDSFFVGNEKSDIRVKNTGNVKAYMRIKLACYFANAEGEPTGAEPSVYPTLSLNDGWIKGSENTYYYTNPIEPDEYTPIMCKPFALLQKTSLDGESLYQVVEVFAEACQSEPDSAVIEAWGATISNNIITAVP